MSELVTDYLEGEMPLRRRVAVRWHLAMCGACTAYYDQMRHTITMLGNAPPPRSDDAVEAAVLRRIGNEPSPD